MLPYYIIFTFLGVCSAFEFNKKQFLELRFIYIFTFFILLLFIGFRNNVGIDIYEYEIYFNSVKNSDFSWSFSLETNSTASSIEIGFYLLNFIFSRIGNFHILIFSIAFFNLYALYFYINKTSIKHKFSFITILFSFTLFREFDVVRQSIALHIFLISLIYHNKPSKYLLINLIGVSFHASAIILIVIYPIIKKTLSRTALCTILSIYIASFIYPIPILKILINIIEPISDVAVFRSLISFYTYLNYPRGFAATVDIPCLIFLTILIMKYDFYRKINGYEKIQINIFLILIINFIIFSEITEIVTRVGYFFYIGIASMFSLFYFELRKKIGKLFSLFPLIFILSKFFFMMQSEAPRVSYTPYSNLMTNTDLYSYDEYLKKQRASTDYYSNAIDVHLKP